MDRTLRGNREDETRCLQTVRHSRVLEHSWNVENFHRFYIQSKVVNGGLVSYKRVSVVGLASHIYFLKPVLFFHRGSPQGCDIFNETELI
jgi:hypothetical protein